MPSTGSRPTHLAVLFVAVGAGETLLVAVLMKGSDLPGRRATRDAPSVEEVLPMYPGHLVTGVAGPRPSRLRPFGRLDLWVIDGALDLSATVVFDANGDGWRSRPSAVLRVRVGWVVPWMGVRRACQDG